METTVTNGKTGEAAAGFPKIFTLAESAEFTDKRLCPFETREPNRVPTLIRTGNGMRGELDFEKLVEDHHAALFRFALSLCRNETDACDLVQETFLLWATRGHQLVDPTKAKSWMFTTLHREFLGRRRRFIRFPHHELEEVEAELPEVPPSLPGQPDWTVVGQCLAKLDPAFRGAVALFYLEDYSYNEIAEILGIPLGTVKSRLARGIAQLQQMLIERPNRPQPDPRRTK